MKFFKIYSKKGFGLYLFLGLKNWYGNELFAKGKIPLIGWDCVKENEWNNLLDLIEKDLKKVRKEGVRLIKKN